MGGSLYNSHLYAFAVSLILIQTSSHVYEHDLCLSKLVEANKDLAVLFRQHPYDNLSPDKRPSGSTYLECINAKWTDHTLTDEEIDHIVARWRQYGFLRDLYRDQSLFREFESYRAQFASNSTAEARAAIVEPGITKSGSFCQQLTPNSLACSEFKARFYKSLCLHSISMSSLILAKATIDQALNESHPPNIVGKRIADITEYAWSKSMIVVGGEQIRPSQNDKLWSLEVFDFLYMFLLKKVIPLAKLDSWIDERLEEWPYERWGGPFARTPEQTSSSWDTLITYCRWTLQPSDLIDLIRNQSWSTEFEYPHDKIQYMRVRGMFDTGAEGDMDFYSSFTRSVIVESMHTSDISYLVRDEESPNWWDQLRVNSGSPFAPGFRTRYLGELAKVGGMDVQIRAMEEETKQ